MGVAFGMQPAISAAASAITRPKLPSPHIIVMGSKAIPEEKNTLLYRWIDVKGQLMKPPGWRIESQWVWRSQKVKSAKSGDIERVFDRPVRRTWIAIPSQFKLSRASSSSMKEVERLSDPPFSAENSRVIAFDANSPLASIEFTGRSFGKKDLEIYTLIIEAKVKQSRAFIHNDCVDIGIELLQTHQREPFFFTGVSCEVQSDRIDFFVTVSSEAKLKRTTLSKPIDEGEGWFYYQLVRPKENWVDTVVLGSFQVVSGESQKSLGEYGMRFIPQASMKRLSFSLGVAASLINYKESASRLTLQETGLTGKISGTYILIPSLLDVAMSSYITLLPLSHSPSSVDAARFYGVNGRLGYRLPVGIGAMDLSFLVGWYFWGMIVKEVPVTIRGQTVMRGQYGIQLNGPQLFINLRSNQRNHRMYGGYIKYAPLSNGSSYVNVTNREIALGALYQLNSPRAAQVWLITLDLAQVKFERSDALQVNTLQMLSYSLGVSRSF